MGACDVMLSGMGQGKTQQAGQVARRLTPHPTCSQQKHVQCSAMFWHSIAVSCEAAAGVADSSCQFVIWPNSTAAFSCSGISRPCAYPSGASSSLCRDGLAGQSLTTLTGLIISLLPGCCGAPLK